MYIETTKKESIEEILNKKILGKNDLIKILSEKEPENVEKIRVKAYQTMKDYCGEKVFLRGLIEFSNICTSNCYYCGIRKDNKDIKRYILDKNEILNAADWCVEAGYGSLVLQSGERSDENFIQFLEEIVYEIKSRTVRKFLPKGLGVTLCVGEQSYKNYERLFKAGAHRYLLRIESSNQKIFHQIHPESQSYEKRLECIRMLNSIGFQVGTGIMIGIPGQELEDLAGDIEFFSSMDIDMLGMGPYIVHKHTPMNIYEESNKKEIQNIYELTLKMYAAARLYLKDVNIASTTALQAINPFGREEGLRFGANVVMPQLTPTEYRKNYLLYEGKPCIDEFATACDECWKNRIESVGREISYNEWGDSKHFAKKQKN